MGNKKYLNEENYQKNNKKVKKVGKILLIIGIITLVISFIILVLGFMGFGSSFTGGIGEPSKMAKNAFSGMALLALGGVINSVGFLLAAAGGIILFVAHRREITAYGVQQVMPVATEGIEKITPTVANAAGSIAESISKGIENGKKNG